VTHDQEEALGMATRIAVMEKGRLRQVGTPEDIYERPRSRFVADFIGEVNLFEGEPAGAEGGLVWLDTADGRLAGTGPSGAIALSVELIPRSTIAQKMDALSSQANLAGYVAVILAAERLPKILPMMMTPAGTIAPARVLVIGAGVAGLQAIATARRLGARVEAYDTRPVVKEQVQSLGAKFVEIDVGETGQTKDGYAKQLTEEQLARQRAALARHCAEADVVITTAQVFGRRAPQIITAEMLDGMRPGSVVVDLAVETGGNVEGVELDREIERKGVRILGLANLPGRVPVAASQMYAANLANFIEHFWDRKAKMFQWVEEDDILRAMTVTRDGRVVHAAVREALGL